MLKVKDRTHRVKSVVYDVLVISASLSSVSTTLTGFWPRPSVRRSVRKVYCGKTAEWIRMPFAVVSGVGRGMGVLEGVHVPQGEGRCRGFSFLADRTIGRAYGTVSLAPVNPDWFLADRTIGRAFGTVCRLSVTFCIVAKRCVLAKKCLKE